MAAFQTPIVLADEKTSIEAANQSINQAFTNVLAAEKAGGNITQLLVSLNAAGKLLADAESAYNSGNLTNVASKADNARQIADQVNTDALALKDASLASSQSNFWYTLIFSIGGAVAFGIAVFFIWKRFRRSYVKKMLSTKPELVKSET